jgi:hypothetical protein
MNFYKQAALALDHLDTKQGSVKGSVAAAGVAQGNESKRVLARESFENIVNWSGLIELKAGTYRLQWSSRV